MKERIQLKIESNNVVLPANLYTKCCTVFLAYDPKRGHLLCLADDTQNKDYAVQVSNDFAKAFIREFGQDLE